jgi:hypothetical protein
MLFVVFCRYKYLINVPLLEKDMMGNKKIIAACFFATLLMFFMIAFVPGVSISSEVTNKDVKISNTKIKKTNEGKKETNPYADAEISIKIIPSIHKTFGYDIFVQGKRLIHQPNIPAMPGNEGFRTKKSAQKVAEFVVKKIRKNEMPPTVSVKDLSGMDVLK